MRLPIKGFSKHYQQWFSPGQAEEVQFVFRSGEVQMFVYDRYDIVEIVTEFIWTNDSASLQREETLV